MPVHAGVAMHRNRTQVIITKHNKSLSRVLLLLPGVERSPEELEKGNVDIYGAKTPYATRELTYTEAAFDKMVNLCEYNILNNKDTLLQALRKVVEKKKLQKSQCPSEFPGSFTDPVSASTAGGQGPPQS